MYHVKIKNRKTQLYTHGANFLLSEDASIWIDKQRSKSNCAWGKHERWIREEDMTEYLHTIVIEEKDVIDETAYELPLYERDENDQFILDEDGNPIPTGEYITVPEKTHKEYKVEAEYVVETEDKTDEYNAKLAAIEARKTEIEQLKAAYEIIDNWQSLSDINLPFLKKFFKRILLELRD